MQVSVLPFTFPNFALRPHQCAHKAIAKIGLVALSILFGVATLGMIHLGLKISEFRKLQPTPASYVITQKEMQKPDTSGLILKSEAAANPILTQKIPPSDQIPLPPSKDISKELNEQLPSDSEVNLHGDLGSDPASESNSSEDVSKELNEQATPSDSEVNPHGDLGSDPSIEAHSAGIDGKKESLKNHHPDHTENTFSTFHSESNQDDVQLIDSNSSKDKELFDQAIQKYQLSLNDSLDVFNLQASRIDEGLGCRMIDLIGPYKRLVIKTSQDPINTLVQETHQGEYFHLIGSLLNPTMSTKSFSKAQLCNMLKLDQATPEGFRVSSLTDRHSGLVIFTDDTKNPDLKNYYTVNSTGTMQQLNIRNSKK